MDKNIPPNTRLIGRFRGRNYSGYRIDREGRVWSLRHNHHRWKRKKASRLWNRADRYVQLFDDSGDNIPRRFSIKSLIRHAWGTLEDN